MSAHFEHYLDILKTRLEKTKIVMQMFNFTKFDTGIIIIIIIIIIISLFTTNQVTTIQNTRTRK